MTLKQYKTIKLVLVVVLAIIFGQSVIYENYLVPIISLVIVSLILIYLRRRLNEVSADERDYQNAGKAAGLAIQIYSWIAVIVMLILYSRRSVNPYYEAIAVTLAYSTCALMFLYAFIFYYYNKVNLPNKN